MQKINGSFFYDRLLQINEIENSRKCAIAIYSLYENIIIELTKDKNLHFSTLFSRISFLLEENLNISRETKFLVHKFRRDYHKNNESKNHWSELIELGTATIFYLIEDVYKIQLSSIQGIEEKDVYYSKRNKISKFKNYLKFYITEIQEDNNILKGYNIDIPEEIITVNLSSDEQDQTIESIIPMIKKNWPYTRFVSLVDIQIDKKDIYHPNACVITPDYLIDVTSIAETFKNKGAFSILAFIKKYSQIDPENKYIIIGNIANFFLDSLMANPAQEFDDVFPKVFRFTPLAFALMDDNQVKEIWQTTRIHFYNIKKTISKLMPEREINSKDCYLEPSFYSHELGIQGRLDVLFLDDKTKKSAIIELKSGKPFDANSYGLSQNHYVQTLLYNLLVKKVFGNIYSPTNYILYSQVPSNNLRFAPSTRSQQYEALKLRNQILEWEYNLIRVYESRNDGIELFSKISLNLLPELTGYLKNDIISFSKFYNSLSYFEKKYFAWFSGFMAKEHLIAKTGRFDNKVVSGQASLWINNKSQKEDKFSILDNLEINKIETVDDDTFIHLFIPQREDYIANFRKGDIIVLYPNKRGFDPTKYHIFKGNIILISSEAISIRLRAIQFNLSIFDNYQKWVIEPDLLDSSFKKQYQSLYSLLASNKNKRDLFFGISAPQVNDNLNIPITNSLSKEQNYLLEKAINAKDYFLLWGPPGTGKTSMMIHELTKFYYSNTNTDILLLAYTNKAVDEICESISIISNEKLEYLRIGSKYGTSEKFHHRLLSENVAKIKKRRDLLKLLESYRVFVGTLSSIQGKPELFKLKDFGIAIIDEASQLLEPMVAGIFARLNKIVFIGDHLQLPAVTLQSQKESIIEDTEFNNLQYKNLSDSFFERIFNRCINQKWNHAFGQLTHQGRMHEDIMKFPSKYFYSNQLKILPKDNLKHKIQKEKIPFETKGDYGYFFYKRVIFKNILPNKIEDISISKSNKKEAETVANILDYISNHEYLSKMSVGVITPFRAQIAKINKELSKRQIIDDSISVDTVERFQGGTKDIIIISFCINTSSQLSSITSLNEVGIDRKLNVALTRAKEFLIMIGNKNALIQNDYYKKLIEDYEN